MKSLRWVGGVMALLAFSGMQACGSSSDGESVLPGVGGGGNVDGGDAAPSCSSGQKLAARAA